VQLVNATEGASQGKKDGEQDCHFGTFEGQRKKRGHLKRKKHTIYRSRKSLHPKNRREKIEIKPKHRCLSQNPGSPRGSCGHTIKGKKPTFHPSKGAKI